MDDLIQLLVEIRKDINRLQYAKQYSSIDSGELYTIKYQQWQTQARNIRLRIEDIIVKLSQV